MDPLSITTSVITLLGAASNVYNFLQSIRNADKGLQSLVKEVSTLNGYLRSIDKALENCRSNAYALSHIDPALWKESKIALSDCQDTITELGLVFKEPKRPSRSNTLFRKARVAAELRSRAGDIASFREKISMSNLSLQTLLQVINVSLSLRSNESQDTILRDLKELKEALKKSSQAATVSYSTLFLNEQDIRLVHHLKGLIRAAHDFHTSASVTASTVANSTQPPPTVFEDDDARPGLSPRLPSIKRMQIETYLSQTQQQVARSISSVSSVSSIHEDEPILSSLVKGPEVVAETHDIDSNHMLSNIYTSGLTKIAQKALQQLDLVKAEGYLKGALKWHNSSGSEDTHHQQRLQAQLALCSLLQGNIQEAQNLILNLTDASTEQDAIAHQLLYALALLQLHELDFEGARDNGKRLWAALQKAPQGASLEANHAMRVLATSYQETGQSLLADAIEAELPDIRLSEPVPRMVDFLVDCNELLVGVLGLQDSLEVSNSLMIARKINDLPIAKKLSSLQMREQASDTMSISNSKCSSGDADDELSVTADLDSINDQPKAKKRSWSNLRALLRPRLTDLYPMNTGAQESSFKLKKMVKVSGSAQISPRESSFTHDASSSMVQSPIKSKKNSLTERGAAVPNSCNVESNSRTVEWVAGQTSDGPADVTIESHDTPKLEQQLQRCFSFQEGVPDCLPEDPPAATPPTCHEMPNNAVFELMDTSPTVKLPIRGVERDNEGCNDENKPKHRYKMPKFYHLDNAPNLPASYLPDDFVHIPDVGLQRDTPGQTNESRIDLAATTATSLEMEKDIYDLLGYGKAISVATREVLSTSSITPDYLDSSSGSDTEISSVFDEVKPSTRQTTFDSFILSDGPDPDSDVDESPQLQNLKRTKSEARPDTSIKDMTNQTQEPEPRTINSLQSPALSSDTATDADELRSLKSRSRSGREFGPAVARLCRYKSPRKMFFRNRVPGSAATGLRKLFRPQNHDERDEFDFGFNNALYTGPDAVEGPFTDAGGVRSEDVYEFAPCDASLSLETFPDSPFPAKLRLQPVKEALSDNECSASVDIIAPLAYDESKEKSGSRHNSLSRTQIDDFFGVSREHCPF
ncbi:hypothetical protein NPX13_g2425 [Xylaria arbuscula]|uniref:REJ domain-containing protein n=1 Tax=Xylaria arbuscula TaxID=114810 RepID=A0A9W8NKF8_9PEZI|nr:hypothetical protein NPX13_g2425 [Xylaria arbuscula]